MRLATDEGCDSKTKDIDSVGMVEYERSDPGDSRMRKGDCAVGEGERELVANRLPPSRWIVRSKRPPSDQRRSKTPRIETLITSDLFPRLRAREKRSASSETETSTRRLTESILLDNLPPSVPPVQNSRTDHDPKNVVDVETDQSQRLPGLEPPVVYDEKKKGDGGDGEAYVSKERSWVNLEGFHLCNNNESCELRPFIERGRKRVTHQSHRSNDHGDDKPETREKGQIEPQTARSSEMSLRCSSQELSDG